MIAAGEYAAGRTAVKTQVGFTENEVSGLCDRYGIDPDEVKNWYDGYSLGDDLSVYSPRSVVNCMQFGKVANYWNQTESFEALKLYIDMNFDGLRDDVLTLLIHLGYLAYDEKNRAAFIPNNEIRSEYVNAVSASDWGPVSKALKDSADTLNAILQKNESLAVRGIEQAHLETAHLQYNDENALSYTISLALYAARAFYTVHREFPTGKGFADMVYIPRKKYPEKPAIVVELKWNQDTETAISQIREKEYCKSLEDYRGKILLVGINYDRKTRKHQCRIEEENKD